MSIETEKMELRSTIKSLNFKKSKLACKMARDVGVTGDFFSDELPLDDPRIHPNEKSRYLHICDKLVHAVWELSQLDYIDEPERHVARKTVFTFINSLSLEESISFLRSKDCISTLELVEKAINNPKLLEEMEV